MKYNNVELSEYYDFYKFEKSIAFYREYAIIVLSNEREVKGYDNVTDNSKSIWNCKKILKR